MISRVLLVACALLPFAWGVTLERCDYNYAPLPTAFRGCEGDICQVSVSQNLNFEIDAVVPYDSNYVFPSLVVIIGQDEEEGYDLIEPVELPEDIGCSGLANGCPIASNDNITWSLNWDWQPTFVQVGETHRIRFTLYDENEITIACFKLPVEIVA